MNETSTQRHAEPWSRVDRISDGLERLPNAPTEAGLRPTSAKFWGVAGLVVLTGVTSLVVATISIWLTPVYMAAMVLIFAAPRPGKPAATDAAPEAPSRTDDGPAPASLEVVADGESAGGEAEGSADPAAAEDAPPTPSKPRKRKAKGKRGAKAAQAEATSTQATWIRVGPGKFVRADLQAPAAAAETPVENPASSEAEPPTEADAPIEAPIDTQDEAEATESAPLDEFEAAGEAVDEPTYVGETPADAEWDESGEFASPVEYREADEAATMDEGGEYGNAPSAPDESWPPVALHAEGETPAEAEEDAPDEFDSPDGDFDADEAAFTEEGGEYGIAPSAPAQSWEPVALPGYVAGGEPAHDPESSYDPDEFDEAEDWDDHGAEIEAEAGPEGSDEDEEGDYAEASAAPSGSPAAMPSPGPGRAASGIDATETRRAPRPSTLGLLDRRLRTRVRRDGRPPAERGATDRPARKGRTILIRVRGARRLRRTDETHRRHHPRSPPRRA